MNVLGLPASAQKYFSPICNSHLLRAREETQLYQLGLGSVAGKETSSSSSLNKCPLIPLSHKTPEADGPGLVWELCFRKP